jgi:hypothetical protein
MTAAYKSLRSTLKIAAIYVFALSTAVACSKFEPAATKIGTVKGTVTPPPAAAGVAPTEMTVNIEKISAAPVGPDEQGTYRAEIRIDMRHGTQPVGITVWPRLTPYIQDAAKQIVGTVEYSGEGVCANETCTKFGVMINVIDTTNGVDFQRVEVWNLDLNRTAPLKRVTQTAFNDVSTAYEVLAFEKLNP